MNYIGISGWTYAPWRGVFYPEGLPQKQELAFASRQFNSIEINGTHYALQKPSTFRAWHDAVPDDFVFSVKGSRFITHLRRLRDVEEAMANFFASGVLALRKKLGPFLWQLPPNFQYDRQTVSDFLDLLPRNTQAASTLAKKHTGVLKERAYMKASPRQVLRHCLEVRHESFMVPGFFELLRRHNIAFVMADTAGKWPYAEDITADFIYIRLHGDKQIYASGYGDDALDRWASRIRLWMKGSQPRDAKLVSPKSKTPKGAKDIYVYFDNDMKVHAPEDAGNLARRLAKK